MNNPRPKTFWRCECGAQEQEAIGGDRWRCTGCGRITGPFHDENLWDLMKQWTVYLVYLGLVLLLGFGLAKWLTAESPSGASAMTEVWYMYVVLCSDDGVCRQHIPPATYSSAETCETARDAMRGADWTHWTNYKGDEGTEDGIMHQSLVHPSLPDYHSYCERLLVEDK